MIVGPCYSGKTHPILKKLKKNFFCIPITFFEQKRRAEVLLQSDVMMITEEKIRKTGEYEGSIVVFDDIWDSNQKAIDPVSMKGRQKKDRYLLFISTIF